MTKCSGEILARNRVSSVSRRGASTANDSSAGSNLTCNIFNMHPFTRSLLGLSVLSLAACGAPAELDESLFPLPNATGYDDGAVGVGGAGVNAGLGGGGSLGGASPGSGGSNSANGGTSGNVSQGGMSPLAMGGGANLGGGMGSMGGGGGQAPGGGGSGNASGGCPDDITVLFKRPANQGGCDGTGCHIPGGTLPDLVSPNVEDRLVGVAASISCAPRPYIGAGDSVLADKIAGMPTSCGSAMPFLTPQSLSAADEQCILDWIEELSGD
jgi:hypothetical protein